MTILMVDPDSDSLQNNGLNWLLQDRLKDFSLEVVRDLISAKQTLEACFFDVILVDLLLGSPEPRDVLPNIDYYEGVKLIKHVRNTGCRSFVILTTVNRHLPKELFFEFSDEYNISDIIFKSPFYDGLHYLDLLTFKLKGLEHFLK